MNLELIEKLSKQEIKTILERAVKLQEEVGELAQEILVHHKASGSQYKKASEDGIQGECVDVILVALSIFFKSGGSQESLCTLIDKKGAKWAKHQLPKKQ